MTKMRDLEVFNVLEKHLSCKKKIIELGQYIERLVSTVVILRELMFPISEYVENRYLASGEFIFLANLIKLHMYTYVLFMGRYRTCMLLLILTQDSVGPVRTKDRPQ